MLPRLWGLGFASLPSARWSPVSLGPAGRGAVPSPETVSAPFLPSRVRPGAEPFRAGATVGGSLKHAGPA